MWVQNFGSVPGDKHPFYATYFYAPINLFKNKQASQHHLIIKKKQDKQAITYNCDHLANIMYAKMSLP